LKQIKLNDEPRYCRIWAWYDPSQCFFQECVGWFHLKGNAPVLDETIPDTIGVTEPGYARRVSWLVALALGAIVLGATIALVVDGAPNGAPQANVTH